MIIRNQLRSDGRLFTWRVAETVEEQKRAGMSVQRVRISRHRQEQLEIIEERRAAADEEIRTGVKVRHRTFRSIQTDREKGGAGVESLNLDREEWTRGKKEAYSYRRNRL